MKINFLIVDDEKVQRVYMKKLIKNVYDNSVIEEAINGEEAINKCLENPKYHIIFMDITMPKCDGITATETIRMVNENTLIYPITAFGEDSLLKDKCNKVGMNGYYVKPLRKADIVEVINYLNQLNIPF